MKTLHGVFNAAKIDRRYSTKRAWICRCWRQTNWREMLCWLSKDRTSCSYGLRKFNIWVVPQPTEGNDWLPGFWAVSNTWLVKPNEYFMTLPGARRKVLASACEPYIIVPVLGANRQVSRMDRKRNRRCVRCYFQVSLCGLTQRDRNRKSFQLWRLQDVLSEQLGTYHYWCHSVIWKVPLLQEVVANR